LGKKLWRKISYGELFKMGAFLLLIKDERFNYVHSKISHHSRHFLILVELAIKSGERNERIFLKNHLNEHICPFLGLLELAPNDMATIPLVNSNCSLCPFQTMIQESRTFCLY